MQDDVRAISSSSCLSVHDRTTGSPWETSVNKGRLLSSLWCNFFHSNGNLYIYSVVFQEKIFYTFLHNLTKNLHIESSKDSHSIFNLLVASAGTSEYYNIIHGCKLRSIFNILWFTKLWLKIVAFPFIIKK